MSALPIVLLVHGMGTHPLDNMAREFKAGLTEAAQGFGVADFDVDEHLEVVEFNYSATLDQVRQKLAEQADAIIGQFDALPGAGGAIDLVHRLLRFQADFDEDEEIYTHWLDVVLYGATFYGETLRIELARKINGLKRRAAGRDIHLVAHSLGTALTHDTLEKLYRAEASPDDGIPDLQPGIDNIKCLWTFANVHRMVDLLNGVTPAASVVRSGPTGCTDYLYNIRHELDPFTWYLTYEPEIESGRNFVTREVRRLNTHSFREYVADPEVARYLLLQMTQLQEPKRSANFEAARRKHRESSIQGLYEKLEAQTRELRLRDVRDLSQWLLAVREFVETAKTLLERDQ